MSINYRDTVDLLKKHFLIVYDSKKKRLEQRYRDIQIYQQRESIAEPTTPYIATSLLDDLLSSIETARNSPFVPPDLQEEELEEVDVLEEIASGEETFFV